jgi:ribosome assembly protein YihI (activator of Der GTPase)
MTTWHDTGKETEPDKRNRVQLGSGIKTPAGVRYKVKKNDKGQILLDPVKLVPAYEAWFFNSPERLNDFKLSVTQAEAGQLVTIDLGPDEDE